VLVGGIVPDDDQPELRDLGVDEIFGPGASMAEMIQYIREQAPER
jgi:methylmalonyl-CoA mutase C-terminal domain/subunit